MKQLVSEFKQIKNLKNGEQKVLVDETTIEDDCLIVAEMTIGLDLFYYCKNLTIKNNELVRSEA